MTKSMLILAAVALQSAWTVRADTPRIDHIKVSLRDAKTAQVGFDLTWPNAMRPGMNHVALWVFFKARAEGKAEWAHLRLAADKVLNPTGYGQKDGLPMEFVVPDGKDGFTGMFLRRTQDCKGTLTAGNLTAVVSLDTLPPGLSAEALAKAEVRVFAIEMAYVPEGPFEVGSSGPATKNRLFAHTGREVSRTERHFQTDHSDFIANTPPYRITGPGAIPTGRQPGKLWAQGLTPEDGGEIPASFPNGFAAFYCMRDVLSQEQYAAFLNTLTDAHAKKRYYPEGHGPDIQRSGDAPHYTYTASAPDAACPYLSWEDGAAFAAWAGLRPITELEYEKANRAGGDIRNMNVGGLNERMVSIASASGRRFVGTHGPGTPDLPADWPKDLGGVVFRGDMMANHGGSISARHTPINAFSDRSSSWRPIRSAPASDTSLKAAAVNSDVWRPRPIARLARAMRADGALDEWDKPFAVLSGPEDLYPVQFRQPPPKDAGEDAASWQGAKDLAAKLYLGWDNDAFCVAFEVSDDKHFNAYASQDIRRGDGLTLGLFTPQGEWQIGLALTKTEAAFHQWQGRNDDLAKNAGLAVVRDEAGGVTRYELRLPLAALGLKPGDDFRFDPVVSDDDDGFGQAYQVQMGPGLHFLLAQ